MASEMVNVPESFVFSSQDPTCCVSLRAFARAFSKFHGVVVCTWLKVKKKNWLPSQRRTGNVDKIQLIYQSLYLKGFGLSWVILSFQDFQKSFRFKISCFNKSLTKPEGSCLLNADLFHLSVYQFDFFRKEAVSLTFAKKNNLKVIMYLKKKIIIWTNKTTPPE